MSAFDPSQPAPYGGQAPYNGYVPPQPPQPTKSKVTAALLAFFLGGLGVHNFYLGWDKEKLKGAGHLGLAVLGIIILVVAFANTASTVEVDAVGNVTNMEEVEQAGALGALAYVPLGINGIWTLVEFIMILVRRDPRLV